METEKKLDLFGLLPDTITRSIAILSDDRAWDTLLYLLWYGPSNHSDWTEYMCMTSGEGFKFWCKTMQKSAFVENIIDKRYEDATRLQLSELGERFVIMIIKFSLDLQGKRKKGFWQRILEWIPKRG